MNVSAGNSSPNSRRPFSSWTLAKVKALPPLPSSFYLEKTATVAKLLLGKGLFLSKQGRSFLLQIIEVEAYLGAEDPASHAFKGPTPRNLSMFKSGGTCYVYLCYGLNFCMNVVTGVEGKGSAVLIRGAIPILGLKSMAKNRHLSSPLPAKEIKKLLSGPGKLTQALGIDRSFDGLRFDQSTFKIVDLGVRIPKHQIGISPRIGISKGMQENLRFYIRPLS